MTKSRRAHGEGSIFQRADGVWIAAVEVPSANGKRRRKTVSNRRRDVVVKRFRELRKDIDAGRVATMPSTTVSAWLEHWLTTVRGPHVRPKTFTWYEQSIRLHIVPQIGSQRLDKLTPEHVRAMVRAVAEQSTSSAQQAHTTLRTALKDAVDEGIVGRNVAAMVRRPKHSAKPRHEFTFEQARQIIGAAMELEDQVWAVRVVAAFMTGARPGELLGLRWRYVDLDAGEIELAWQLQQLPQEHGCGENPCGKIKASACSLPAFRVPSGFTMQPCQRSLAFTPVKSKAGNRVVPLLPMMAALLRHLYTVDSNNPHDLVFHHTDGTPYTPKQDYAAWKALLHIAGLPEGAVGYQSRHTTATLLRRFGVDEDLRMQIMGHSSAVAHHGYLHADQTEKRQALEPLSALTAPSDT